MKIKTRKFMHKYPSLVVKEGERNKWKLFHLHHYMTMNRPVSESLPKSCKFFTFYWLKDNKEILIGCLGVLNQISKYPARRITRLVVLPEYQGLGFSKIMLNSISEMYKKRNINMYISTFHPRLGNMFDKSSFWTPSNNNMQEFRKSSVESGQLSDALRDGQAMFRYKYNGYTPYKLSYNPLELTELMNRLKELDRDSNQDLKERKDILVKIKKVKHKKFNDLILEPLSIDTEAHKKAKEETRKLFNKNKRVPLTSEERKALKAKKKLESK